eukprot:CAMPEP_0113698836 /NCGR_PEP_ID=MMETSP0038_2-20120614/22946_1 /TAXON_ID=2898 /ORGANISM="Cryptomonas paramecium" /LENGTH=228 /DNA_ID=CAMNT_0000622073 /DNA_START=51 /DNA_END=734 /DNA_ORIENTATION=+ /assembly_acc=CAM_ASM_000170
MCLHPHHPAMDDRQKHRSQLQIQSLSRARESPKAWLTIEAELRCTSPSKRLLDAGRRGWMLTDGCRMGECGLRCQKRAMYLFLWACADRELIRLSLADSGQRDSFAGILGFQVLSPDFEDELRSLFRRHGFDDKTMYRCVAKNLRLSPDRRVRPWTLALDPQRGLLFTWQGLPLDPLRAQRLFPPTPTFPPSPAAFPSLAAASAAGGSAPNKGSSIPGSMPTPAHRRP